MASIEELRDERIRKLEKLKEKGMDPYSSSSARTHTIAEMREKFSELKEKQAKVTLVGRIMNRRGQGAISFFDIRDGTGKFQGLVKKDVLDEGAFTLFMDTVDAGDFIEATGILFITNQGEETLEVREWKMLTKSLRPLPDKWHGLSDEEARFRKRFLDLLLNDEIKELFAQKMLFWDMARHFMKKHGFTEVETPTLELTTGGAEARPFKTHHHDFDIDVYLRISVGELWQKRLMAAGYEKTFEIGRIYRNEGTSPNHLQEFTNLEFYWAYADYEDGMALVQELYQELAQRVFGTLQFSLGEHEVDLAGEWERISFTDEVRRQTDVDVGSATENEIKKKLDELGVVYEGETRERLIDTLWKHCRKNITGPAFLVNHPKTISPLAKSVSGKEEYTQRFQPLIAGTEIGNGYSELNNPLEQRKRFEEQQKLLDRGDEEAMMPDWDFVEMLEHGMPPTCGFGFGERLFAVLAGKSLREVQLFPLMKPKK